MELGKTEGQIAAGKAAGKKAAVKAESRMAHKKAAGGKITCKAAGRTVQARAAGSKAAGKMIQKITPQKAAKLSFRDKIQSRIGLKPLTPKTARVLLVYNPIAGNGVFAKNLDYIIQRIQDRGCFIMPFRSGSQESLDALFLQIKDFSFSKIIVAGGDGTLHTVVNMMKKYQVNLPLAIYPSGTANDFAAYFEIPTDIESMVSLSLTEVVQPADLGIANGRYFVNVCGFGFPVDVGHKTDQNLKNAIGVFSYYLKGVEQLSNFKAYRVKVESEAYSFEEMVYFMVIMNGRSAGGFKHLAREASIQDGLLDVIAFKECPIFELMPLLVQLIRGEHADSPHVIQFKAKSLCVEYDEEMATDVDGEPGPKGRMEVCAAPAALQIIAGNREEPNDENSRNE